MDRDDHELLVRIDERTQTIAEAQERAFAALARHGERISSLEKWRAWILGLIAALGLMVTLALKVFG